MFILPTMSVSLSLSPIFFFLYLVLKEICFSNVGLFCCEVFAASVIATTQIFCQCREIGFKNRVSFSLIQLTFGQSLKEKPTRIVKVEKKEQFAYDGDRSKFVSKVT